MKDGDMQLVKYEGLGNKFLVTIADTVPEGGAGT